MLEYLLLLERAVRLVDFPVELRLLNCLLKYLVLFRKRVQLLFVFHFDNLLAV